MASLLLAPLACGGDDGGDDGSNVTTGPTTTMPMTTGMTMADDDGVDDALPTTAADDDGDDDGGVTTTDGGDDVVDDTTTGGAEDTTTGGGGNEACEMFCADYFANEVCGRSDFNDYGDEAACATTCAGFSEALFMCKVDHLAMVNGPADEFHCEHASAAGGGPCV